MAEQPHPDEPRDPFAEEAGEDVWSYVLRKGEMVFLALAELPTVFDVTRALKNMPESDLKSMILERLYVWHAIDDAGFALPPDQWLGLVEGPES